MIGSSISFSVIIPTFNRLPLLRDTIDSILRQTYPQYELIVINDGGTDGSTEYLEKLQSDGKLRFFSQSNQGPARGRNLGLLHAKNNYVAFIDDDCIAPPDWLERYALRFTENAVDGLGGSCYTGNPGNMFALANDHIMNYFKSAINKEDCLLPFLTSNNTVYLKKLLDRVGGFDPSFRLGAEERDLNLRLVESGAKLAYDASIEIGHYNDETLVRFLRHQYLTGQGSYLYYRNARERSKNVQRGSPGGIYFKLFTSPFSSYSWRRGMVVFILIVLAQIAVTSGYLRARIFGYAEIGTEISAGST